jgi:oxygen-independent coproporphyrinogen-3 oxidase
MRPSPELIRRLDVAGPRYTSYPTVPVWTESFGPDQHAHALERAARSDRPLSLYVHIPFCRELCSYCGCNVIITRDQRRVERYLAALGDEAALVAERLGARRSLSRIHFGGGTPTFLDERQLVSLWRALTGSFEVLPGAELAVEINPVVTRPAQIELLAELGFNRLSLGVQDFDAAVQQTINRVQSVIETRQTIEHARALGYRSVNLDLIYGLPRQSLESFRRTIAEVVALRPERVALFSFAFVPSVKPHQRRLPLAELPPAALKLELFQAAHDDLVAAGYRAIGMDHFALPGDELAVAVERRALGRDFQGYTTERAPHTVALGMSAISNLGDAYVQNHKSLAAYEGAIENGRLATERGLALDAEDQRRRDVIHALMCNFEVELDDHFAAEVQVLRGLAADGLVELDGARVTVTPLGRLFVRNVAMVFDAYLRPGGATPFSRAV